VQLLPVKCALKLHTLHRPWHSLGASRSLAYSFSVIITLISLIIKTNPINLIISVTRDIRIILFLRVVWFFAHRVICARLITGLIFLMFIERMLT
jgi:hypothetical protein